MAIGEENMPGGPGEPVKLVIWDLDETFWHGTLSEGGIQPNAANIELVKTLTARGIVNAICSKNDFAPAREALERLGLWEYFIFPQIAFAPKGAMIAEIIEAAQLRAPSILFVDDNPMNLQEALHYNPGLQIAGPEMLPGLLDDARCKGKPDPEHERLKRYKVLEQKQVDQAAAGAGDNTAFLRGSDVRISFHYDVMEQFPRIHDLVNRTNQLNFTKNRWPEDEEEAKAKALEDYKAVFNSHWGYVKVADRYGKYGICGFFLLRFNQAVHFLFSCRAMNMGVEQFVWHKLGKPSMQKRGEISSTLDILPDWISVVDDADADDAEAAAPASARPRVCLRGACDLSMMAHYLRTNFDTIEEYAFPFEGWAIHRQAREIALSDELHRPEVMALLAKTPGMPGKRFLTALNTRVADVYVISFSPEIFGGMKRSRSTGAVVPLYLGGVGDKEFSSIPYEELQELNRDAKIQPEQWAFLQQEYESVPFLAPELLTADLHALFRRLEGKLVVVVQLNSTVGTGQWQLDVYAKINAIVLPVAQQYGCHIIDMAEFVRTDVDLVSPTDFGVHYSRDVYSRLATRVDEIAMKHGAIPPPAVPPPAPAQTTLVARPAPGAPRHLISIGHRCDVAFQLRMHGNENVAHFFDWLATPMDGVIKILDADFDVFKPDHLTLSLDHNPHAVQDRVTGTIFHHQFPLFAGHMQPDFLLHYQGFIAKFRHLAARFRTYMETRPVTLVRQFITREEALRLEEAVLGRFPGADVRFLYIVPQGKEFETPNGYARGLKHDGSSLGDPTEWVRVLSAEGLIGEPYRHGTVEILGAAHDDYNLSTDNRFSEAQLLAAIEANPRSVAFPLELARLYELKNQWAKCEEMAISALARAPRNEEAQFAATLAQWRLNNISAAEAAERFAPLVAQDNPAQPWLREAADACIAAGQLEVALHHINRALEAAPVDQRNHLLKLRCLFHANRLEEADLALSTAMQLGPVNDTYQHMRAKILASRNELAAALEIETGILQRAPKNVPSLMHAAALAEPLGRTQEVRLYFEQAMPFPSPHQKIMEQVMSRLSILALASTERVA